MFGVIDLALASLLSEHEQYQKERAEQPTITVIRNAPPRETVKQAKERTEKAQVVKAPKGQQVFGLALPDTRTPCNADSAKLFLTQMRQAGRRKSETGRWFTDSREIRNDSIQAIAAFVGFDTRGDYGQQEQAAHLKAKNLLRPIHNLGMSREEERQALRAAKGFVPGLPDFEQKAEQHREALITLHVEEAIDLLRAEEKKLSGQ
jgi:hypothetical protein